MKFKVGDKVKIKADLSCMKHYKIIPAPTMIKYKGKVAKIIGMTCQGNYILDIDNIPWWWSDDMLEPYKIKFTKSDLKDGDTVTCRDGSKKVVSKDFLCDNNGPVSLTYYTENLKDADGDEEYDIVKVERPVKYEIVFERKEEILDETEKRYLASVIRPFRHKIKSIEKTKIGDSGLCYLNISLKNNDSATSPNFKKDSMYKGMEPNKEYSLEELGL